MYVYLQFHHMSWLTALQIMAFLLLHWAGLLTAEKAGQAELPRQLAITGQFNLLICLLSSPAPGTALFI